MLPSVDLWMNYMDSLGPADLIGAIAAVLIYALAILVFIARLAGSPRTEHWLGLALVSMAVPLVYLLVIAGGHARPPLYYVQLLLMVAYLVVELLLDYVLKLEFRSIRWMAIAYVMLFFSGTGGMIGVASHAGEPWMYTAIGLFLSMAILAFVQHAKTGL